MLGTFDIGEEVTVTAEFSGVATHVVFTVTDPNGDEFIYETGNPAVSNPLPQTWTLVIPITTTDVPGTYFVNILADAGISASSDEYFVIRTPLAAQLCTVEEYRTITGDSSTPASAVSARIESSTDLIEEFLQRTLSYGTYTETLEVWYADGGTYVYPIVTPVRSVATDVMYAVDKGGRRLRNVQPIHDDTVMWTRQVDIPWSGSTPVSYATVTYVGGYTSSTLPYTLKEAIAWGARALIRRTPATTIGAQSARVGDVSITYPKFAGGIDALVPGASLTLKSYKRRRIRF